MATCFAALTAVLLLGAAGPTPPTPDAGTADYTETITRAVRLLPHRPPPIRVVTVDPLSPELRRRAGPSEAFIVHGDNVVYVRRQGRTLRSATRSGGVFVYALAAIIWHEMAHIDGADEDGAMRREEELWRAFIVQRRVDTRVGLQYLALLTSHRQRLSADRQARKGQASVPQGLDAGWTVQEPAGRRH